MNVDDIEIIEYKELDLSNSMLVVAFPTVGLISSIAGHFIIDSLKLDEIGSIVSNYFMPATVIHKSNPSPPVRIYAGKKTCGPNSGCEQLAVIISEFMPPFDIIKPLADKIFEWSKKKNCSIIVTLEGMHVIDENKSKNLQVYGVGSNPELKKILEKYNIKQTQEGMITGVTGVLLYEGVLMNRDVICLLSEAHVAYPDSRAAGNLLEKLDVMLPGIKINPKPLYREAENIEKNIRKFMKQSQPTAPALQHVPPYMYG
ncbi:MAG: proteasome assembly chaperone family protein [Candidatus Asgardarchaeum californiense]|nr:MAG: proteasome assembly chaperone family protein [Candidatus Asgardarchaeum californiense]